MSPDAGAPCAGGTWDHDGNPATACVAHAHCSPGQFLAAQGTATHDTVCQACAAGTFSNTDDASACAAWSDCAAGSFVFTAGSATSDRACQACATGSFSTSANAATCTAWSDCAAGTFVATSGSTTSDRVCSACAADTYSYTSNAASCDPAVCGNGHVEVNEACDTTTSATCADVHFRSGAATCSSCALDFSGCGDPELVDIAFDDTTTNGLDVCALDAAGALRCSETNASLAVSDPGPYLSIAGGYDELCATHPGGAVTCWNSTNAQPTQIPAPAGAGTTFLEDDADAIYLPGVDGQSVFLKLDIEAGLRKYLNTTSLDLWIESRTGSTYNAWILCGTFVDGSLRCYDSTFGNTSGAAFDLESASARMVIDTGGPWIDVAVGHAGVCGIRASDHAVTCWATNASGTDPAPATIKAPEHARAVWGSGGKLLFETTPGAVQILLGNGDSADPLPDGVRAVSLSPGGFSSQSYAQVCWVGSDGRADCDDQARGVPLVPTGGSFLDVDVGPRFPVWVDTLGRAFASQLSSRANLLGADGWVAASSSTALCGLRAGQVDCTGGSHFEEIPPGPFLAFSIASPFAATRPFCGIRTNGTLACTSLGQVLDAVPAGTFTDVDVEADPYFASARRQWAVAIASDGSLVCWGDTTPTNPCANVPSGIGFVHVVTGAFQSQALRSDGTVFTWSDSAAATSAPGATFDRYVGRFGINADGSIGQWANPAAKVPTTHYVTVVDDVALVNGGDPALAAEGCGLTSTGTVECWEDNVGSLQMIPALPGTWLAIAGSNGSLLMEEGHGLTYVMGNQLPQTLVRAVETSGYSYCALDLGSSALSCGGAATYVSSGSYPNGTVFDRLLGEKIGTHDDDGYCGFTSTGAQCWGASDFGALGSPAYSAISVYPGSFTCGVRVSDGAVECSGTDPFSPTYTPTAAPASQSSLPSLDVASDYGATCRIRNDGELQCWGSPFASQPLPSGPFQRIVATASGFVAMHNDGTLAGFESAVQFSFTDLPSDAFAKIDARDGDQCGITTSFEPRCWGGLYPVIRGW